MDVGIIALLGIALGGMIALLGVYIGTKIKWQSPRTSGYQGASPGAGLMTTKEDWLPFCNEVEYISKYPKQLVERFKDSMNNLKKSRGFADCAVRDFCKALEELHQGRFDDMSYSLRWAERSADQALMIYIFELELALQFAAKVSARTAIRYNIGIVGNKNVY